MGSVARFNSPSGITLEVETRSERIERQGTNAPPPPVDEAPDEASFAIPSDQAVTVAAGDSLYAIAQRYGLPISSLIEANDLEPPYTLRIGQRLQLQTASLYQGGPASPDSAPQPPPEKPAILTPSALLPATVAKPIAPPPPRSTLA